MYGMTFFLDWEVALMEWIQRYMNGFTTAVAGFITDFSSEIVLFAVACFFYFGLSKKLGKFVIINLAVTITFGSLLKNIFLRRRPYFDHQSIKCLKSPSLGVDIDDIVGQGFSLPSLHTACSATTYGSLAYFFRSKVMYIIAGVIALLVGTSRFALGVHYPTDVFIGWLIGILVIVLIVLMNKAIKNQYIIFLILAVVCSAGWFYCTSTDYYTGYGLMVGIFVAILFEEKIVNFNDPKGIVRGILRTLLGTAVFMAVITLLKLPFDEQVLEAETFLSHILRASRYAISSFLVMGVYPMVFSKTEKLFCKKSR